MLDEANPAASAAEIAVQVASIDTREPQRDAHLKSADFFEGRGVSHPHLPQHLGAATTREGRRPAGGDLTIHGVTQEVALEVDDEGRTKDPWGGQRAGFTATTEIKRREFGLTWNQLLEAGGFPVSDEVKISLERAAGAEERVRRRQGFKVQGSGGSGFSEGPLGPIEPVNLEPALNPLNPVNL